METRIQSQERFPAIHNAKQDMYFLPFVIFLYYNIEISPANVQLQNVLIRTAAYTLTQAKRISVDYVSTS
jgi:hypothetical protein